MFYDKSPIGVVYFKREAINVDSTDSNHEHLNPSMEDEYPHQCYLVSLGITAPFRGFGIASHILRWVEAYCMNAWGIEVGRIVLHVQRCNTQAVRFYLKNGFVKVCEVNDYYTKVEGRDALFLKKQL